MFEIITELIEEPEKKIKYLVFGLRTTMSIVLASFLYSTFISSYILLDIFNSSFWFDFYAFIIEGRLLLAVFLFLISRVILFDLVSGIIISPLVDYIIKYFVPNMSSRHDEWIIRWPLIAVGAIKYNGNKIIKGKDFDYFYKIIKEYRKKAAKEEIEYYKNMLITRVIHLYYAFLLIYYYILDTPSNYFLNIIIIISGVILGLFYYTIHFLTQMLEENENQLYNSMRMLKSDKIVEDFIEYYNIPANSNENESISATPYARYVYEQDNLIVVDYLTFDNSISAKHIDKLPKLMKNKNWQHLLLISTQKPGPSATKFLKDYSDKITLIVFSSEKTLWKSLYSFFEKSITKESLNNKSSQK
ncbi:hypothetical protein [Flavobacterium sp. C4GT6]|uniref:hypothetical protein n=1 Tax=Flavobacterium sp. C4GT6 TaxID=3103818 RepID=UPI002ECFC8E8